MVTAMAIWFRRMIGTATVIRAGEWPANYRSYHPFRKKQES